MLKSYKWIDGIGALNAPILSALVQPGEGKSGQNLLSSVMGSMSGAKLLTKKLTVAHNFCVLYVL